MHSERFPNLVGLLYDGLLCPDRWNDFLLQLNKQIHSRTAFISLHDAGNRTPECAFSAGMSEDVKREWTRSYGIRNPLAPEVIESVLRTGAWAGVGALDDARYCNSEYARWLRKCDMDHSLITAFRCGFAVAALNVTGTQSAKPFRQHEQKLMSDLVPHLRRVLEVHTRNGTLRSLFQAERLALDSLDTGVIAVDDEGRIVLTNAQGDTVLQQGQHLTSQRGRLTAASLAERVEFERLIRSAIMTGRGYDAGNGAAMVLHGNTHSAAISIIITPFRSIGIFGWGRPCALVFIGDPAAKPQSRGATLQSLFSLTPAECRLAGLLHEGLDLAAAAEKMSITAGTARFMLKRVFAKTGSHRQSELIQLLNRIPGDAILRNRT